MAVSLLRVPLWRECVDWLDRLKILRSDQFPPNSELIHFGQCIRDGFILCYLITKLDPNALDFHDVCQRTQMSQASFSQILSTFIIQLIINFYLY